MYAKSTRPSAKRDVQKFRSAQRDDRVLRSAKRAMRMCPRSGQIFFFKFVRFAKECPIYVHASKSFSQPKIILLDFMYLL